MTEQNTDVKSLAHTKWNCKYHVVFAPKYRRKVFYNEKREAIRDIIRTLCQWKGVEIVEGEVCPDHIHLLLSIPPKYSVSGFMGYLKGKSSLMIFQRFGNMKFAYRNREFWCKGILCRHSRKEHSGNQEVHSRPDKAGSGDGPAKHLRSKGPVHG